MMSQFLGAFLLLLCISANLVQSTGGVEQEMGPYTKSRDSKTIKVVFQNQKYADHCLSTFSTDNEARMYSPCKDAPEYEVGFSQFRYGDDGVFLMKHTGDYSLCHEVMDVPSQEGGKCTRKITNKNRCNVTMDGHRFWFEGYEDEGWGILRSAKNISEDCSREGPPSLHAFEKGDKKFANLGSATEEGREAFLWKIKKFDCKHNP